METATIEQTEWLPAKPVQVYDAFVNARKDTEFTGAGATCEPRTGTRPKNRSGMENNGVAEGYGPSRIEFRFVPKDDGTEVTMVHSGVPVSQVEAYRQGWVDYYWIPLKKYFAKSD